MSLFIGLAFLVFWLMIDVFNTEVNKAALVTAIIFLVLGLLYDYGPLRRTP